MRQRKRMTAFLMAGMMVFASLPANALAAKNTDTGGLCEHHPEHTEECGYTEGIEGTPCGHEHTEVCYSLIEDCVHEHGAECYLQEDLPDDTATPSDADQIQPTECIHECSEESGCIAERLDCQHGHDEDCGYIADVPGNPCAFVCEVCHGEDLEQEKDQCSCEVRCTVDIINADCPVCSADGADLTACEGGLEEVRPITITDFDPLDADVAEQSVPAGTKLEDLNLPVKLGASGYVGAQDSGGAESLIIDGVKWESDRQYDENAQGPYIFTVKLPEGYTLAKGVSLPEILVMAEPVNLLAGEEDVSIGNVVIDDTCGPDCSHRINGTSTQYTIKVTGGEHNITIAGVDIDASSRYDGDNPCAFAIENGASVNLTLEGENVLKSGGYDAGIQVYPKADLRVLGDGDLSATGGEGGTGIGGGWNAANFGSITLSGTGTITAKGGNAEGGAKGAAGIGGACGDQGAITGIITIESGTIFATGGSNAAGIGTGTGHEWNDENKSTIIINGGIITATGGGPSAGIGGGERSSAGTIIINGAAIKANGTAGSGIGEGMGWKSGRGNSKITITDSTVESQVNPVVKSDDISISGCSFTIKEGDTSLKPENVQDSLVSAEKTVTVYGKYILNDDFTRNDDQTLVILEGAECVIGAGVRLTNNGTIQNNGILSISDGGKIQNSGIIYNWGEISGEVDITNSGTIRSFGEISGTGTIDNNNGFIYNGGTIAGTVTILGTPAQTDTFIIDISKTPVVIEMCATPCPGHIITGSSNDNTITVMEGTHNITLKNVDIDVSGAGDCAFTIKGGASVNLTLEETNSLKSGGNNAGIYVSSGTVLEVLGSGNLTATGSGGQGWSGSGIGGNGNNGEVNFGEITFKGSGTIEAIGVAYGAGIGGGCANRGSTPYTGSIAIESGTIIANGGYDGSGIGGGAYEKTNNSTIIIAGGMVTATGGTGAGIGGGRFGPSGTVIINGGTVTASGNTGIGVGRDFSGGERGTATITGGSVKGSVNIAPISDGSTQVYLGIVEMANATDVSVDGKPYYISGNHGDGDNKLYLYMTPESTHTVTIRDNTGKITTYINVPYEEGGVNGNKDNGYFNFVSAQEDTPSKASGVSFLTQEYNTSFGQPVGVSVKVDDLLTTRRRSASMNSVRIAVTPESSDISVAEFSYPAQNGEKSYELDVSKLDAGTYTLTAWYGGSADSKPSDDESTATLTINPASLEQATVSLSQEEVSYDGGSYKYAVTTEVELNGKTLKRNIDYTVSYKRNGQDASGFTNAGEITVIIKGKGNYTGEATAQPTFTIEKITLTPTITYTTTEKVYDGNTDAPAGMEIKLNGVLNGDDVSATAEFAYNSANVKDANTITANNIVLKGADQGNYQLSETQLTTPGTITKSIPDAPEVPTKAEATDTSITLNTISGAEYKRDNGDWQDSPVFEGLDRNTAYTFYARIKETANTKPSLENSASISTEKTSLNGVQITVTGTYTYNGTPQTPTVEVTYNNSLIDSNQYSVSATDNIKASENARVTVAATQEGDFTGEASQNFTIKQADLTIKANDQTIIYGQSITEGTMQVTAEGLVNGETLTGITLTPSTSDAITGGEITPSAAEISGGGAGNYKITYTAGKLTINQATPQVTAPTAQTLTYTGQPQALVSAGSTTGGTLEYSLEQNGTYSEVIPNGTDAGDYTVWYKVVGNDNYQDIAPQSVSVNIAPKNVTNPTIQLDVTNFVYDGTLREPSVTVTDGSTVIPANEYDVEYSDNKNVGNAVVTVTNRANGNYGINGSTNFTITQAPLVISNAILDDKIYDGTMDGEVADVIFGGMVPGETLTLGTDYTASAKFNDADAGTGKTVQVTIDWKETEKTKNYLLSDTGYLLQNQTISPAGAPQIDWPTAAGLTYGQPLSESTLSGGSTTYGSFNWQEPDQVPTAGNNNSYPVIFTPNENTEKNYKPVMPNPRNVTVAVNQAIPALNAAMEISGNGDNRTAKITITVNGVSEDDKPTGIVTLTGDGITEAKDLQLNNGTVSHEWTGLKQDEYQVLITYRGDTNYEGVNTSVSFDTSKKMQAIEMEEIGVKTYGDTQFKLSLSKEGEGTGAVTYESSDPTILSINGDTAVIHKAGDVTITAKKAEDPDYNAAEAKITLTIRQAKPVLTLMPSASEQRGGGAVTLTLAGLPTDGMATISSSVDSVIPTETENGVWKVDLPNADAVYTFTANYAGDENHEPAMADCTVTVQRRSSSSGGSGSSSGSGSGSAKPTGGTETGSATPVTENGRQTVTVILTGQKLDDLVERKVERYEVNGGVVNVGFSKGTLQQLNNVSGQGDIVLKAVQANNPAGGSRPAWEMTLVYRLNGADTPITLDGSQAISVKLPYNPAAGEQTALLYAITLDGTGQIVWMGASSYDPDQKAVLFSITGAGIYGIGYQTQATVFTDISDHWAKDHIQFVADRGLITGTGNNRFSPDAVMTQKMFVAALERLADMNGKSYKADADIFQADAIAFSPDAAMTREEMAMLMKHYADKLGYTLPATLSAVTFADSGSIRTEAKTAIQTMQRAGILSGKAGNLLDPQETVSRAEAAAVLHRFVEIVIDPQAANGWTENASGIRTYYQDGRAAAGWLQDGSWYWLENGGIPFAGGWKQIDGKWYFFHPDGTMAENTTIDGYSIGPDGART